MDVLVVTTPLVVMVGLLALMQHIESRMSEKAPVRITTGELPGRAAAQRAAAVETRADIRPRRDAISPLLAGAPFAVLVTTAILAAAVVVRMAA
ncbi:hypothetical protein [Intrasporangium sp. DVR]|uniref:hypothetical protein n=1 Tax=Intrasporangium sp. DVR TaxID=3127867 RepID=UPI00313A5BB9